MARNEKTSARVAKIAAKVLAIKNSKTGWYRLDEKSMKQIKTLAALCLAQATDHDFIPKSPQARKAMKGALGARIKSKKPSWWPSQRVLKRGP